MKETDKSKAVGALLGQPHCYELESGDELWVHQDPSNYRSGGIFQANTEGKIVQTTDLQIGQQFQFNQQCFVSLGGNLAYGYHPLGEKDTQGQTWSEACAPMPESPAPESEAQPPCDCPTSDHLDHLGCKPADGSAATVDGLDPTFYGDSAALNERNQMRDQRRQIREVLASIITTQGGDTPTKIEAAKAWAQV